MSFAEIRSQLEELLKNENVEEIRATVSELSKTFQQALESRPVRAEIEGTGADNDPDLDEEHIEIIRQSLRQFHERREEARKSRTGSEKQNLREKEEILAELTRIISEEENIGKAYQSFSDLKDRWRNIGNVPYDKHHDIQREFSRLSELFYYNMNIYKELRENDLKKNLGLKGDIIEKLKELAGSDNAKDLENALRLLQKDWDHVGATYKENWEELRNQYWEAVKLVQEKITALREERVKKQKEFLAAKKILVEKASAVGERQLENQKDWEKATEELLTIQAEWKTLGYASREDNEKVWQQFRQVCDSFFERKKEFFSELKSVFEDHKKRKLEIIQQAEALKNSTDWKEGANALITLQKEWQRTGPAGKKAEHQLWLQFRAACDHFFNRKKEFFAAQDLQLDENLKKKEAFIASLPQTVIEGEDEARMQQLETLSKEYTAIGNVPAKERERLQKAFREAMDQLYTSAGIDPQQKEMNLFKAKIENLKQQDNATLLLNKERLFIRDKINRLQEEIVRIENNLGFFGNSKNANSLLKEYQDKIESHKQEIEFLKLKLRVVPRVN